MKVEMLTHTPEPDKVVAAAARLCYSDKTISELMTNMTDSKREDLITKLVSSGHESPFEHVTFTFGIEGISRACSHQLVRHRIGSYSQQSQRYVTMDDPEYVLPNSIETDPEALELYNFILDVITRGYDVLVGSGIPEEDARYLLPNATATKIVVTLNARSLFNFFKLRSCNRAQEEIRNLSDEMLRLCKEAAPKIFRYAGPSCVYGKCTEGKMACGNPRADLREE